MILRLLLLLFALSPAAVRAQCWTEAELAHTPGEEIPQREGGTPWMDPPVDLAPQLVAPPLPVHLTGSIRSVDVGDRKVVALTFDIGEQNNDFAGYDGRIIDILRASNAKATLYMGGKWMATHRERAAQLIADPLFEMANHAWQHGNMRVLTSYEMTQEIDLAQAQYELAVFDLRQRPCASDLDVPPAMATFRFPYGTCSQESLDALAARGLPAVQWDVVTADPWRGQTANGIEGAVRNGTLPGSIILMHANGRGYQSHKALPNILEFLNAEGYELVTVTELLAMGTPRTFDECFEERPGDNARYDAIFGKGITRGRKD